MTRNDAIILLEGLETYFGRAFSDGARRDYVEDFERYDEPTLREALERIKRAKAPTAHPSTRIEIQAAVRDVEIEAHQKQKRNSPVLGDIALPKEKPLRKMAREARSLVWDLCDKRITVAEFWEKRASWLTRHDFSEEEAQE